MNLIRTIEDFYASMPRLPEGLRPQPMVPGETIRRYLTQYYAARHAWEERRVDFAVVPELLRIVLATPHMSPTFRASALAHLQDARSGMLLPSARWQHLDIAASRYWEGTSRGHFTDMRYLAIHHKAGGV
jgi:hypothetical protein